MRSRRSSSRRLGDRWAFSLAEVVMVFIILAVVMGIAWAKLYAVENKSSASIHTNKMRQVASSLSLYQQSRGDFPSDAATVANLSGITVTTGESSQAGLVSVGTATVGGEEVLGLAVRNDNGECYTMRVAPFGSATAETRGRYVPTLAEPCSGTFATTITGTAW